MDKDKLKKIIQEEISRHSFAKMHNSGLSGYEEILASKLYDMLDSMQNGYAKTLYKAKELLKKGKTIKNKTPEEKQKIIRLIDSFFTKMDDLRSELSSTLDNELIPSLKETNNISEDNLPLGAENSSSAPYNQKEYAGESVDRYEPDYDLQAFNITLDDGNTVSVDFESVMEEYFKDNKDSFDIFYKMFPESDELYVDMVKYLTGQGYDFAGYIQKEITRMIENGNLNGGQEKHFDRMESDKESEYELYEDDIHDMIKNAFNDDEYVIYHTYIKDATPQHKKIDTAANDEEAEQKVSQFEQQYPGQIFYYDRRAPIQSKYKLN